jgi:hypothetical protein
LLLTLQKKLLLKRAVMFGAQPKVVSGFAVYLLFVVTAFHISDAFGFQQADARYESSVFINLDRDDEFVWQNTQRYLCEVGKYYWDCQEGLGNYLQIMPDEDTDSNVLVCSTQGTTEADVVQRSELRIIHYQDLNTSYFSKFSMKLPADCYIPHRATIFWQIHQLTGGNYPPLGLVMDGLGNYVVKRSISGECGTPLFCDYLPRGSWHKYFVEYQMGNNNNGHLKLWMDFEKKMEFEGATTMDEATIFYTKFGIYRYSDKRDFVSYFDDAGWSKYTSSPIWDANQMTEVIPTHGLTGQWKFDEPNVYGEYSESGTEPNVYSTVAWDSSGGCSYVGNVRNGATRTKGYVGRAVLFDGVNDYISIPDSGIWDTGSAVTASCRFKTADQQDGKGLIMHDYSNYKYMLYLTGGSGAIRLYVRTASGTISIGIINTAGYYADNKWHHAAGVYDRYANDGKRLKLYVDGELVAYSNGSNENILSGDEGIFIGRYSVSYFKGAIDDVSIYNYGLSAEEIERDAFQNCIARWNFDDTGPVAKEFFRSDNPLILSGTDWATGYSGNALLFDGVNDCARTFPSRMWDAGSTVTASCRFKTAAQQNDKAFIACDKSNYKYMLYLTDNSGTLKFYVQTASGVSSASVSKAAGYYADDKWHNIAGVYDRYASDGKRLKLYVDGYLAASNNGYDEDILGSDEGIAVGVWSENYFNGAIDEVSIYKTGLSRDEVIELFYSDDCIHEVVGDIDGNCKVGIEDLALLLENWLLDCTYPNCLTNPACY